MRSLFAALIITLLSLFPLLCQTKCPTQPQNNTLATEPQNTTLATEPQNRTCDAEAVNSVDWDNSALYINGIPKMIYSAEFHPFRLPSPSLWYDVLEKIRAMGFNTVSFYINWALIEGQEGLLGLDGLYNLTLFCDMAKELNLYLIARPGPYINAEVSGGGFPGWLQRLNATLRSSDGDYLDVLTPYMQTVASILAKYDADNNGPVILFQIENEYTGGGNADALAPDPKYMQYLETLVRAAGVKVPLINNDAINAGNNAPGTGEGAVDVYGYDMYPFGFDCNIKNWPLDGINTTEYSDHLRISPLTPLTVPEFQGGSIDWWGSKNGFEDCAGLFNHEYVRVIHKNQFAAGVAIFNVSLTVQYVFGGTNWGNLGFPEGYTSYDYGAAIAEDRTIDREKYSEMKLQGNFLKVAPYAQGATPQRSSLNGGNITNDQILLTQSWRANDTGFFVVRHQNYSETNSAQYQFSLSTEKGSFLVPFLGGSLTLPGRDSKIHVVNYWVADHQLLYCTAEIFTWQTYYDNIEEDPRPRTVLVVYGGLGETHELSFNGTEKDTFRSSSSGLHIEEGGILHTQFMVQWDVTQERKFLLFDHFTVYLIDRTSAYRYWTVQIDGGNLVLIVSGGHLVRGAEFKTVGSGNDALAELQLRVDFNETTTLEIIGVPRDYVLLSINGEPKNYTVNNFGNWEVQIDYQPPEITLPDLSNKAITPWRYLDSLPEIQSSYNDSEWRTCHLISVNTHGLHHPDMTYSLYGSDYGYHSGILIFRGHFNSTGLDKYFTIITQGGTAFANSVWINGTFLGSWAGNSTVSRDTARYLLPELQTGVEYIITVLVDNMGLEENDSSGGDQMKIPRGILHYELTQELEGYTPRYDIAWKVTGNLGGEDYRDKLRGPLNEGGLYVERQGFHLGFDTTGYDKSSPFDGIDAPGVAFYTTNVELNINDTKWDVPINFEFEAGNATESGNCRVWLWVNGFQMGRYIPHIGPQTSFHVPEGVLLHNGTNHISLAIWAPEEGGARISSLKMKAGTPMLTGRRPMSVAAVGFDAWALRDGAY
ncbi:beta-galactosidase precursor [Podospora australis]|uniref:beta-galactosidase n=1 Tax=Podospora australis TaxID=1536484 RepID=A0AAN7AMF2_9PEZI|nr:beta-galactosidase precursor [Podospora australis]